MIVTFREENHRYESDPPQQWISSTKCVKEFITEFDAVGMAENCSKSRRSKWGGMEPEEILRIWEKENIRSTTTGSKFHAQQEAKAIAKGIKRHRGMELPVIHIPFFNGVKTALHQILEPGCYLEHIIYNEELGVCGQTDIMLCDGEYIDVMDYKTNKEIEFQSYTGRMYNTPQLMKFPFWHFEDCNFYHYIVQLNIYMYLALMKNKHLKPGKMEIVHVQFAIKEYDQYGYPVTVEDADGNPIVTGVKKYDMPYLGNQIGEALLLIKQKYAS